MEVNFVRVSAKLSSCELTKRKRTAVRERKGCRMVFFDRLCHHYIKLATSRYANLRIVPLSYPVSSKACKF